MAKSSCFVSFPEFLNVAPYCTFETTSTASTTATLIAEPDHFYRLSAVIAHYGHATAVCISIISAFAKNKRHKCEINQLTAYCSCLYVHEISP